MKPCRSPRRHAFTLIELLVTIAVIGILAAITLPVLSKAKIRAQAAGCSNNLGQLQKCWHMYLADNNDFVPPNRSLLTNGVWRSTPDSWIGISSAPSDVTTDSIKHGLLFKYDYNRSMGVYRCPSDRSRVKVSTGKGPLRTRSYSMNGNLGGRRNEMQNTVLSTREVPDPSRLFVFIDEHEDSIDDAHFLVWPMPDERWVNLPAGRHGQIGVLTFVDGHVESWRWNAAKTFAPKQSYWKVATGADLLDLRRLQKSILHVNIFGGD